MGKYHCTIDPLFDWFGISCMTTDNFCFYLQNRLFQTSQTGGQQYSDTSPFSIPWYDHWELFIWYNFVEFLKSWSDYESQDGFEWKCLAIVVQSI